MSNDVESIMAKLKRPPSVPNWARYNHPSAPETKKAIVGFALGMPTHSLAEIYPIIGDMITFGTSEEDALKGIGRIKAPRVRQLGREIIRAFAAFNLEHKLDGIRIFEDFCGHFRVARDIMVPVRPTFIILEDGRPTPVFFIGWASLPLTDRQKRLLTTAIEDAVLSFGDFRGARARIICSPRPKGSKSERHIRHWTTTDYPRFSADELSEQLDRYTTALENAAPDIKREIDRRESLKCANATNQEAGSSTSPSEADFQGDLFT